MPAAQLLYQEADPCFVLFGVSQAALCGWRDWALTPPPAGAAEVPLALCG